MKKLVLSAAIAIASTFTAKAQNVYIPDANFKAYLIHNPEINTNSDNEIQVWEAQSFTGGIYCGFQNIADLTGIEEFTALTELVCFNNQLSALDLSNNTALYYLHCNGNQLSALDLSYNTALDYLDCGYNQLNTLDLSNNTALIYLNCSNNQLSALDLSNNTALYYLHCGYNQLSTLDLSYNPRLHDLYCYKNQLSTLDLSNNTALYYLDCSNNQLTTLDVKNGNNRNLNYFYTLGNPDLTCIQVDDVARSTTNWTGFAYKFDATSSFSENCSLTTSIKEVNKNIITTVYPNPANSVLNIDVSAPFGFAQGTESLSVRIINMLGATVATQQLNAGTNSIDISSLTKGIYFIQSPNGGTVKFVKE